jgi:CheY-like chemotaxis protein
VVSLTRPKWKEEMASRGITIDFETSFQKGPLLSCNETQMKEAFTNLVLNAVDALPKGGTISLRTQFDDKWAAIRISDNGTGMAHEVRQRCFEPFFSTKGRSGMGIGLAMVYGIVRGHDGQISVESEEGEGSTFTVLLPIDAGIPRRRKPAALPLSDVPPLQILIVDDEPWSRSLMVRHLSHRHHKVISTQNGETALAKFQEHKFDLVITDRAMPDMSGDSVAMALKQISPEVPIIMVTGFGEIMKATGETPKGVDEILSKPVTRTELDQSIARVMSKVKKRG